MDIQQSIKSDSQIEESCSLTEESCSLTEESCSLTEESCSLTDSDQLSYATFSEDESFYSDTEKASISESAADGDNGEYDDVESEESNSSTYSVTVSEDGSDYSSSDESIYSTCSESSGLEAEANPLERGDEIRQQVHLRSDSGLCVKCQKLWLQRIKHRFMNSYKELMDLFKQICKLHLITKQSTF